MSQVIINNSPPQVILWGGTGQAKVIRPIIEESGAKVVAVFDDTPDLPSPFADIPLYRGFENFKKWVAGENRSETGFCVAIGNPHGRIRIKLHEMLEREGLQPVTLAHSSVSIADNAEIGSGCQMLAGSIIAPEAKLGRECIINTNAGVDHECHLEDGVELGPGATLCGLVRVGINGWIGAGATVVPRITIGADAVIGAGAVVIQDVADGETVVGVPARPIDRKG